jgi:hypothetical protein
MFLEEGVSQQRIKERHTVSVGIPTPVKIFMSVKITENGFARNVLNSGERLLMDIYCPICSEPWDTDTLHDVAEEKNTTFSHVLSSFYKHGCEALGAGKCVKTKNIRAQLSSIAYEMMGDDVDGISSMLEDAEYMGMM